MFLCTYIIIPIESVYTYTYKREPSVRKRTKKWIKKEANKKYSPSTAKNYDLHIVQQLI